MGARLRLPKSLTASQPTNSIQISQIPYPDREMHKNESSCDLRAVAQLPANLLEIRDGEMWHSGSFLNGEPNPAWRVIGCRLIDA